MARIGSHEAKSHMPRLLERVARGERITITKRGVPVAELIPVGRYRAGAIDDIIERIRSFRRGRRLGSRSLEKMTDEGRR